MKTLFVSFLICFVIIGGEGGKFRKYMKHSIRDFGTHIAKTTTECADKVLHKFHHKYPETTNFLINFQLRRNFCVSSYNDCTSFGKEVNEQCIDDWKHSVELVWNEFSTEMESNHPTIEQEELDRLLNDTNDCLVNLVKS